MKNDRDLLKNIQDAIKLDPTLKSAAVMVQVHEGMVTLSGVVKRYLDKIHTENITKSIDGVKAIVEHITVEIASNDEVADEEIAKNVLAYLKLNWVPLDRIKVKVEEGHVTLDGEVCHNFQKQDAKKSVGSVAGVKVFTNNLVIAPETAAALEKRTIEHALLRYSATVDQNIRVNIEANTITLNGTVQSYYQKEEAEKIAWNTPGVMLVKNELIVG
ncbi:BON domain-containing protein [Mucilaginibacter psychrotolerans]|uniref:BON domain-containing protein n=1 Tax=Mucilaginibacter psychrotolerans TaxID=1524096 RepID=A0A4Y8SGE9_9SPHI|nr:BON domain-containing protein [Mucilaginibacter psychrotolerans]TFF37496.1 BON domain-containing protein [Mucilaginibacter psychrotolerans]